MVGRRRDGDPLEALIAKEREVLELMAEGLSHRAIANRLVITDRALERHVRSIFGKLGLTTTGQGQRRVPAVLAYLKT
jgi:DNA-binding NarL/FixJ family response regulator